MALASILDPPKRVQFVISGFTAFVQEEATLFGVLPLPDVLGLTDPVILTIDATPRQTHRLGQRIPQHPVEEGFDISDDVQREPKRLTLDGVNSDMPPDIISAIAEPLQRLIRGVSLSVTAWGILKGLMGEEEFGLAGATFDVITGLDIYYNMMIESLIATRSADNGKALWYTANLKEIRTVSSETIATGQGTGAPIGSEGDVDGGRVGPATPSAGTAASGSSVSGAMP